MENKQKYNKVFMKTFDVEESKLTDDFDVMTVEQWDSVAQMELIAELEQVFDIMFDPEDVIEFTSYKVGKEILRKMEINIE
ncbi:acyl carrier protein [Clostridium botulinum]|uniref:acyl carrier protein n=1 Tax=Clostridium botulinum TaxID=1491 RepID=UPI0005976946|nr:acyl carrier protein [Clostridium botulinum]KIL08040.1 acyl carrier protein [Clostridium botulinum]MBY6933621.1 acyl carrier protein [Clostridium botulinum]NFL83038.1 acyl carrier protein [Clostridium botulinum]NFN10468.1 acyl carrier protein [Clostridium botulinum]NFN80061.1 acyl carrier protein [Clostridium botulinum]